MSTEEQPIKKRFTCPNCGNNVSAPPEDVLEPVDCPHCGQAGMFLPAKPKPEGDSRDSEKSDQRDSAAASLAATEFSDEEPPSLEPAGHTRKAPPRRKKSVTPPRRGGDTSRPRRDRPGYRRHDPRPAPPAKEGNSLMTVFLAIVAVVLSVIIIMIMIPKNLDFIQGYPAKSIGSKQPRNLLAEVQQILGPQDRSLAFTEAEVNAFLNDRVKGTQRGPFKGLITFRGAYADFEKDRVEFFIERTVMGIPFTMSLKVSKTKFEHKTTWRAGGGSIGKFGLSSRQFKPIIDAFNRLGVACEEELGAVEKMKDVRFEKDRVVLVPMLAGSGVSPAPPATPEPKPEPEPKTAPDAPAPAMEPETMEGGDAAPAMEPDGEPNGEPDSEPDSEPDTDAADSAAPKS